MGVDGSVNAINPAVDLKSLAMGALEPIRGKLQCLRGSLPGLEEVSGEINNEMSTSSAVEALIRDATSVQNLVRMQFAGCTVG